MDGFTRLIEQKYFVVDRFDFGEVTEASVSFDGAGCLVGLAGRTVVSTSEGEAVLDPGQAVVVPKGAGGGIVDTENGVSFLGGGAPAPTSEGLPAMRPEHRRRQWKLWPLGPATLWQ